MTLTPLTQNDIIALKQADHIVLSMVYIHGRQNIARITCAKQVMPDEFKTWEIHVASAIMFLDDSCIVSNAECQYTIANSCLNWIWQSAVGQLVKGDEIELLWNPDEISTFESVNAGWHGDTIKLVIFRGQYRFHFIIGTKVVSTDKRFMQGLKVVKTPDIY